MEASTTRLYASSIAIVSGLYSLATAGTAALGQVRMMTGPLAALGAGGVVMLLLGVVVLIHGGILLTRSAAPIRRLSGPLMILWAALMLANQALVAVLSGWGMGGTSGGGMMAGMDGAWDLGMVAVAVLMLASGLIMSARPTDAM